MSGPHGPPPGGPDDLRDEEEQAKARLDRATAARLWELTRGVRGPLLGLASLEALMVVSIVIRPWFLADIIDNTLAGTATLPVFVLALGGLMATWLIRFGGAGLAHWLAGGIALRVLSALRQRLYAHIHTLSMRYFDATRAGRIVARVDRDVEALQPALVNAAPEVLGVLLRFLGASTAMLLIDPWMFAVLAPLLPVLLVTAMLFRKAGQRMWGRVAEAKSRVTAHLCETITGVGVIQQCAAEAANRTRYGQFLSQLDSNAIRASFSWGWFGPFTAFLSTIGIAALLLVGGYHLAAERITVGQLAQCVFYVFLFLGPLQELGELIERLAGASAAAQRVFLLLDTQPDITDNEHATALPPVQGEVTMHAVHFAYVPDRPVLHGIDLRIVPGETVAVVGATGHGKSTLVQLLTRFYDPTAGTVAIDGHDLRTVTQESLRRQVAVVPQDNVLFSGSIRDNLRLAKPDASDAELDAAVSALGADEVLLALPHGLASECGAGGSHLSHGQRQLVCLVRAFIANPRVLVLDEATSAVDIHTERRIRRALKRLCEGRTAVIVAHRLATVRDADRILVIHDGLIAEQGSHDQLMAANGRYAALYASSAKAGG
jgi:ATP-binding cassette, subfamily B, bacterial